MQETAEDVQYGFLMCIPVYRQGMPTETVEERRQAICGFVFSPFRAKEGAADYISKPINVELVRHRIGNFLQLTRLAQELRSSEERLRLVMDATGDGVWDWLQQAMIRNQRNREFGALMFIDMDRFKLLNDTHGPAMGDALLVEVAARLKECVRERDTVCRLGATSSSSCWRVWPIPKRWQRPMQG